VLFDRHVANTLKSSTRKKRGGGESHLDIDGAEQELAQAGASVWESPEACFDREWRRQIFACAVTGLKGTWVHEGKGDHFAVFEKYDLAERRPT
jgi:hypothetical protein